MVWLDRDWNQIYHATICKYCLDLMIICRKIISLLLDVKCYYLLDYDDTPLLLSIYVFFSYLEKKKQGLIAAAKTIGLK